MAAAAAAEQDRIIKQAIDDAQSGGAAAVSAATSSSHGQPVSAALAAATRRLSKTTKAAAERRRLDDGGAGGGASGATARRRRKRKPRGAASALAGAADGDDATAGSGAGIFEPAVVEKLLKQAVPRGGAQVEATDGQAPVFMAAVMEYLTAEMVEAAGNAARENRDSEIDARHIQAGISADDELVQVKDNCRLYASWKEKQRQAAARRPAAAAEDAAATTAAAQAASAAAGHSDDAEAAVDMEPDAKRIKLEAGLGTVGGAATAGATAGGAE